MIDSLLATRRRRFWLRLVIYAIGVYIAWCTTLYFSQDGLLFYPDLAGRPKLKPYDSRTVIHHLEVDTSGQVESWFIPAPARDGVKAHPAVIFFHGNGEIIDFQDEIIRGYQQRGMAVLLPEYRGYGRSAGRASQDSIVADALAFHDWMLQRDDVDRTRVVYHGRSLGGGVAAQLASMRKPAAMILQSTFTSVAVRAYDYLAPAFLVSHPFRTDRIIVNLNIPMLIMHGTQDDVIPVKQGRRLKALAPQAVYLEFDCNHEIPNTKNEDVYWNSIEQFLRQNRIIP